jgi:hypothetical protein
MQSVLICSARTTAMTVASWPAGAATLPEGATFAGITELWVAHPARTARNSGNSFRAGDRSGLGGLTRNKKAHGIKLFNILV